MSENSNGRHHRNFGSRQIYLPKKYNDLSADYDSKYDNNGNNGANKFRFKNSLIITPNYEVEFESTGGIKYIKNHDDCLFFSGGGISAQTNGVKKLPVMQKRAVNKLSGQKKLIIEEKYNYEEKYDIHQNIILYYEENRVDFQVSFVKNIHLETKDITSEFALDFNFPEIYGDIFEVKEFSKKEEIKQALERMDKGMSGIEYIYLNCRKGQDYGMTIYPERKQTVEYKKAGYAGYKENKNMIFSVANPPELEKNYVNIKFYLEKYKVM